MSEQATNPAIEQATERTIFVCNSLLKGEISAIETYVQAIEKFKDDPHVGDLIRIKSEHEEATQKLRNILIEMHAAPETDSGAWGAITKGIQATANLFGENSATFSLKQGEQLGKKGYESALDDIEVKPEVKNLIRGQLLPMVNNHIERLDTVGTAMSQ